MAVKNGRIERIYSNISQAATEEIDAVGRLLLPGVIDPQVHFRDPGAPHKEDLASGSRAAVKGGVTSFLEMPNTRPTTTSQDALDAKLARAADVSVGNYGFFIGATPDNLDVINTASPVCGIKVFMGSSTGDLLVSEKSDLEKIFANGERLIAVHAEDEQRIRSRTAQFLENFGPDPDPAMHSQVRDVECAVLATKLALELSNKYQRRLHILHLSTGAEADMLRENKPAWVSAEVIPNHLLLNINDYAELGTLVQMNPPIRTTEDNETLFQALRDGVIDIIATDHAPHTLAEKQQPYPKAPSGMAGVETSLPLMLTEMKRGSCTLEHIQRWMCYGPARLYGIPNKGKILEGWDADLTIVDLETEKPVRNADMFTKCGWTPYAGRMLTGWSQWTIVSGQVAYENGRIRESTRGNALSFQPKH